MGYIGTMSKKLKPFEDILREEVMVFTWGGPKVQSQPSIRKKILHKAKVLAKDNAAKEQVASSH